MSREDGVRSAERAEAGSSRGGDRPVRVRESRPRESTPRVAAARVGRGPMPEWVSMALLVAGAAGAAALLKLLWPLVRGAGGPVGDKAESVGRGAANVLQVLLSWLPVVVVVVLAGLVARWWLRRRARRRVEQVRLLVAVVGGLMPADWPQRSLVVRSWRGVRPVRFEWTLTAATQDHVPEWRQKLQAALELRLAVPYLEVEWPTSLDRRVRVTVPSAEAVDQHLAAVAAEEAARVAAEEQAEAERLAAEEADRLAAEELERQAQEILATDEGRLFVALDGLVPDAQVEVTGRTPAGEMSEITLRYGETNRDISPNWRGRVLTKVIQRFGGQWRSEWHTQERRVVLRAVPALPHPVPWKAPKLWEDVCYGSAPIGVYGVTEEGHIVGHELGPRQPHALVVGPTGTGKTEDMKVQMASLMLQGVIQVVIAPKPEDWVVFLGMPGVAAVATSAEDRAEVIAAVWRHMKRRVNARALFALKEMHPDLDIDLPELSLLDQCYMQVVIDEVTQNLEDLTTWWQQLSKEDKAERAAKWGKGSDALKTPPQADMLKEIAQLARSARIHLLQGMQRADQENFGDNTQMRDNFPNRTSMGSMYPIGSEQIWGDRQTGVIPISNVGEGMTNGARFHRGKLVGVGTPIRFKSLYITDAELLSEQFQALLAEVAPDVSDMDMGEASAETRSIEAAAMGLRKRAGYGFGSGSGSVDLDRIGQRRQRAEREEKPRIADTAAAAAVSRDLPGDEGTTPGAVQDVVQDVPSGFMPAPVSVETDADGRTWDPVHPSDLKVKDVISVGEIAHAIVVTVPEEAEDDFTGDPVIRVELKVDGKSQVYDLDPDDSFHRLRKAKG